MIDHAHLVIPESINPVLAEKKFSILNQKVADLRLGKIEYQAARMAPVREVEGIPLAACGILPVEEIQALIAELPTRMVVDHVE